MKFCECGCGRQVTRPKNRFITGHNYPSKNPEVRKKLSEIGGRRKGDQNPFFGRHHSKETLLKLSESLKDKIPWNKGVPWPKEICYKMSISQIRRFQNPEERQKISQTQKGRPSNNKGKKFSEETCQLFSQLRKKFFTSQEGQKIAAEHGEIMKRLWGTSEYRHKMAQSRHTLPNKSELHVARILSILELDYRYFGDGLSGAIAGKWPDFYNEREKKVIELFGDYWHANSEEEERVAHFAKHGIKCLVIWERELSNENELVERIKKLA